MTPSVMPRYVEATPKTSTKPSLFSSLSDDQLLSFGVPPEWLQDVRNANEGSVLDLVGHLPAEAAEALLNIAIGVTPQPAQLYTEKLEASIDLMVAARLDAIPTKAEFEHPDASRRFRTITSQEELERALDYPWEKWTTFLHPAQRQLVQRVLNGPARVSGSAGTAKTIVALHRAVHLARANRDSRVLLTTFSEPLANALRSKLWLLISNEPRLGIVLKCRQ